jgi:hypothetical protein
MPSHTSENVAEVAKKLRQAVDDVQDEYARYRSLHQLQSEPLQAAVA